VECPWIVSTDVDGLRFMGEWHKVNPSCDLYTVDALGQDKQEDLELKAARGDGVNRVGSSSCDHPRRRFDPLAIVRLDECHRRRECACGMLFADRIEFDLD
jgi:hypothetical protein